MMSVIITLPLIIGSINDLKLFATCRIKKLEEKLPQSVEHLHCMLSKSDKSTTEKLVGASPLKPANSSVKFPDYSNGAGS